MSESRFTRMRSAWESFSPKSQGRVKTALVIIATLVLGWLIWGGDESPQQAASGVPGTPVANGGMDSTVPIKAPEFIDHTIKPGEYIITVAAKYGVPWQSVVEANFAMLTDRARLDKLCGNLSAKYRRSAGRRGHFCNELVVVGGQRMLGPNTLQVGEVIRVPTVMTPPEVQASVARIPGTRVVIVVDDTGSMQDDHRTVMQWYIQAAQSKNVVRVLTYADNHVRVYDNAGGVQFQTVGQIENTRAALERAMDFNPDMIVLVTDEPGDDWRNFKNLKLAPVIAHSLHPDADGNLRTVARITGGNFLKTLPGSGRVVSR